MKMATEWYEDETGVWWRIGEADMDDWEEYHNNENNRTLGLIEGLL